MSVFLWSCIASLRRNISRSLDRTLAQADGARSQERTVLISKVSSSVLEDLRVELRVHIDKMYAELLKELSEADARLVLFPIVLLCDEMVMSHLPKEQHTMWHLIQSEMFQINYGGDVFYEFADERLSKPETPPMVFGVLYYCLSAGFSGRFGFDSVRILRYKGLLGERIPGAVPPSAGARRKRPRARSGAAPEAVVDKHQPHPAPRRSAASYYYISIFMLILATVGLVVVSTNL